MKALPVLACATLLIVTPLRGADLAPARAALDRDDFKTAIAVAKQAIAENSGNAEAWIVLGHGLSMQIDQAGFFAKAGLARQCLAAYLQAAKLAPENVEAHTSLLEFYRQAPPIVGGSLAKAKAEAAVVHRLDPALGAAWLVRLALLENRDDDAWAACAELLKLEPDTYRTLYWLGATCAATGRDLDRGERALRQALRLKPGDDDPGRDEASLQLGVILEKRGDRVRAAAAFRAALAINPKLDEAQRRLDALR